jgi:hypothetical protein
MRSTNEEAADNFDCDLYRLVRRAEAFADEARGKTRNEWDGIVTRLRSARPTVRAMMHAADRKRTSL